MDENCENWRGCSMDEIYRNLNPFELRHVEEVRPSENHTVLFHYPIKQIGLPPKPLKGHSKWDSQHVRIPSSIKNQYPVINENGNTTIESRWEMIEKALLRSIDDSHELEKAILSYNSKYKDIWNFRSLHKFFDEMEIDDANIFFKELLPKIVQLALRLPELVMTAIPLLKQGENKSVTLSQQQISCLLANSFLCTYPRRNTMKRKSEYSTFPDINFNRLYQSTGSHVLEKLKCIFHYFRRVCNNAPTGVVTFTRRSKCLENLPNWEQCEAPLGVTPLHITSVGTIEDQGAGLLQVDFANKFLGGGVLGSGCVQEEIRFVICPELIISKLFTEALRPCETLVMIGAEQFSKYSGYASTFMWDGNFIDNTPIDESHRKQCHIVAIDALHFMQSDHQYREELMLRELNKAYVGFVHTLDSPAPGIASGNWGCGAFGGEVSLKALIQIMACTITKRPLVYFTFGNEILRDEIHKMHTFFIEENVKVNELWLYLKQFKKQKLKSNQLFEYIKKSHLGFDLAELCDSSSSNSLHLNRRTMTPKKSKRVRSPEFNKSANSKDQNKEDILLTDWSNDLSDDILLQAEADAREPNISKQDLFESSPEPSSGTLTENLESRRLENVAKKLKKSAKLLGSKELNDDNEHIKKKEPTQKSLINMLDYFYNKT